MTRILCVEDAADMKVILQAVLKGYELVHAETLSRARGFMESGPFDLVLLDIDLPDGNGLEFLSEISIFQEEIPVILLTGHGDFVNKASAFSMGAEDFMVKPFDPRELKLRVDAKVRKAEKLRGDGDRIRFGSLVLDVAGQRLLGREASGVERPHSVSLTASEFRILALLARFPAKIFARSEILERVWGDDLDVSERAVDVHVSNLRKKVAPLGLGVESVVGVGYRIEARARA